MPRTRDINLGKQRQELIEYFNKKNEILTIYIFGSHGTTYENEMSDIDLGISFDNEMSLMQVLTIAGEIEMIISKEVDLLDFNKVNILLKYKIIKTGEIIFERDEIKTANLKEKVLKEYFDFGFKLKKMKEDFRESLRKEYVYDGWYG